MMTPLLFLAVAVAGGVGSALRFVVDGAVQRRLPSTLPLGTAAINVTGSFALGLVTGFVMAGFLPPEWQPVVGTGLIGGYTTFSTASLETVRLVQKGRAGAALAIAFGVLIVSVAAAVGGVLMGGLAAS